MSIRKLVMFLAILLLLPITACDQLFREKHSPIKIIMVLDTGGDKDHGYNEYSIKGAKEAALEAGVEFEYFLSDSENSYGSNVMRAAEQGADMIFTVGFALAEATAKIAPQFPDRHFVIMDYAYYPGAGCSENASDCYTQEGGLANVTSLIFREEQPAYLAGTLAACMTDSGILGTVAGVDIPPVRRFVEGFENGALSVNPDITLKSKYIPSFNDPDTGYQVAKGFVDEGADVLFSPAGATGIGALRAATDADVMAVGVDVDQYLTFPEAGSVLITSVMKNVDVAAQISVTKFITGQLKKGIQVYDLKYEAVGLAPYHDWESKIPSECKELVALATKRVVIDPSVPLN